MTIDKRAKSLDDGWHREALYLHKQREEQNAAMFQLTNLVEQLVKKEVTPQLVALAFHHVAMDHGTYAGKKTLRLALKSSIEELSCVAPAIFPPDRVPDISKYLNRKKRGKS